MDVPADRSRPTSALPVHPEAVRPRRRRRPTGAAPPLPYRLQTSGIRWLVAAVILVGLTLAIFARGLRGPAMAVTVVDDAVVQWLAGLAGPGLVAPLRGLAHISSWWVLYTLYFGLLLVLLVLRRWRHLLLICEPVARQRDLLVLRCWLGMVDRAGVKVEWPERRVDDDLDPGEGRRRMKQRRGSLGHCSGITSGGLVWSVARGRPALSRCSDLGPAT